MKTPAKTSKTAKKPSTPKSGVISRDDLSEYLFNYLGVARIKDYCPNGLQVEGRPQIKKIITGVTASLDLIERAIEEKVDAILVHHGWFWKNDDSRVVGQLHDRLKQLMSHDINLFAYHLPLDIHPQLGNNAQLGKMMGWTLVKPSKKSPLATLGVMDGLIWEGKPTANQKTLGQLARSLASRLGRDPLVVGDLNQPIKRIAWCTGGAQNYIKEASLMKVDAYISGEISESTFHAANELGVAYIAAGHHATERYGIQALGQHLEKTFRIKHQFIDLPNPV